jgi:hypothetical protein
MSNGLGMLAANIQQNVAQMNQKLAEVAAHSRAQAAAAAGGIEGAINGFYQESRRFVKSFDEQRGLRYRPASIQLPATILGAGTAGSGYADFRISMNEDFIVHEIRGYILMNDLANEPSAPAALAGANGGTNFMSPLDRATAKALNCSVLLLNKDTKVPVFENANLSLATICPEVGGKVMHFNPDIVPGFILPHNMTLEAQFNLQSANAFFNTASTTYGIALSGVYMSRDRY